MKRTYVYDQLTDSMVEVTPQDRIRTHEVMPEIGGYRSMIDGSWIDSRTKHREHLKRHGCVEVGNESIKPTNYDVAPKQRHELIRSQVDAMTNDEFKRALKRDVDRVRWNSNH